MRGLFKQGTRSDIQGGCKHQQRIKGGVGRPRFEARHVRPKEPCVVGQFFLCHAAGHAQLFEAQAQSNTRSEFFHIPMLIRLH